MLEQAKRPTSALKSASAPSADAALRRPIDREVDPFGPQLAVPENKRQTKKAGCSTCGGGATPCPTCDAQGDLETPPPIAKRSAEADRSDPAERQADAIGAQIGAALPDHAVGGGVLSEAARATAESHVGVDLEGTRVDGGSAGHAKAQSEDAWAVTEGSDIAFADGQLQQNAQGRFLLGHELVHVAQQRAAKRATPQRLAKSGGVSDVPAGEGGMSLPQGASAEGKGPAKPKASRQPSGVTMRWGDLYLAADKDFLVDQLLGVIEQSGDPNAAERFVKGFEFDNSIYGPPASNPTPKQASGGAEGAPNQATPTKSTKGEHELAVTIAPFLRSALATVQAKMDVYLEQFSKRAIQILDGLLDKSEERLTQEEQRYGLRREVAGPGGAGGGPPSGDGGSEGASGIGDKPGKPTLDPSVRTAGLIGAAKELLAKNQHINQLKKKEFELRPRTDRLVGEEAPSPELIALGKEISRETAKLRILHEGYQAKYPILGSFSKNGLGELKVPELEKLTSADSTTSDVAGVLLAEIESRRTDIATVRNAAGSTLPIWQLPKVVAITSAVKGVKQGSWEAAAIKGAVTDSESSLVDTALTLLSLVLSVAAAAIPGGVALVVGGAAIVVDLAQIAKDVQAYDLQKAASNTDFDRARAISDSDPSLFWLAISIAGVVLDVGLGVQAFRALRRPVLRVLEASTEELKLAQAELRTAAETNNAAGIADDLVVNAQKLRNAKDPKPAFELVGEARGLENEAIDKAARQSAATTKDMPNADLSNADIEGELEFLARSNLLSGDIGARVGHLGRHTWIENGLGRWCRHSIDILCRYLGEGPEANALRITNALQAGVRRLPRHHLFPQAKRSWFSSRGFKDIDGFCVELEEAEHQAIHGGGNWKLGMEWEGEWNKRVMTELESAEEALGRKLSRSEIINIVMKLKSEYKLSGPVVPYRDR